MRHPRTLILVLLFALGGAGGFVFARRDRNPTPSAASPEAGSIASKNPDASIPTAAAQLARRIATALGEIEAATTGDALQSLWEASGPDNYGEACRRLLLARWAEVDPDGGFDYFLARDDQAGLRAFSLEWALRDPAAVATRAVHAEQRGIPYALGEALAYNAPERYLEFIAAWNQASGSESDADFMDVAFSRLYAADPGHALALFDSLTGIRRIHALSGLAAAMAKTNLSAAQDWAESLSNPTEREAALGGVAYEIGRSNPEIAATLLKQLADPFAWNSPGKKLLREMCGKDPAAAIAWVGEHFESLAKSPEWVASHFVQSLWAADESKVMAAIAGTAGDVLRNNLIDGLRDYTNWRNIGQMLASADGLDSAETRQQLRLSLLVPMAQWDTLGALRYLKGLPAGEATPELWESFMNGAGHLEDTSGFMWDAIARLPLEKQGNFMRLRLWKMAQTNPEQAIAKLDTLREHPDYPVLTTGIAGNWARHDPAGAMAWIGTLNEKALPLAAKELAERVPTGSAPQALAWLQSLPLTEAQLSDTTAAVARGWVARDGIAASALIRDLPPGPARQGAITGLVGATYETDPTAALEWIEEIEEPSVRDDFHSRIVNFQAQFGRRAAP